MSTDDLLEALLALDEEYRSALIEALEDDPEDLRAYLEQQEFGPFERETPAPDDGGDAGGEDDWTVITDEENGRDEAVTQPVTQPDPDEELTPAEQELYSIIQTVDTPRSASEVVNDLIEGENPGLLEEYSSFGNRGWVSSKLNKFAKVGLVGKYREGREVKYTANIETAVRNWALKNDMFVEDLSPDEHAAAIAVDTGMSTDAVETAIRSMCS